MYSNSVNNCRRSFLKQLAALSLITASGSSLISCSKKEPLVRIASNVWPGYELLYLARSKNYFSEKEIRLVEVPSATMCIQSLSAGTVEGAMLTLDEVLTAKSYGLDLEIIAMLDISDGADVVMVNPKINELTDLKGKRIAVEQSAVGAVMLNALLEKSKLSLADIEVEYLTVNQHLQAYKDGKVDALVTFEPVRTQLLKAGAKQVFDSSEIPGRIIDVLAVLSHVKKQSPNNLKKLVQAHFMARDFYLSNQKDASTYMAKRLQLNPEEVPSSFNGLKLPDLKENHYWMAGNDSNLKKSAASLKSLLLENKLLERDVSVAGLVQDKFL